MLLSQFIRRTQLLMQQGLYESRRAMAEEAPSQSLDLMQLEERLLLSATPAAVVADAAVVPQTAQPPATADAAQLTDQQVLDVVAQTALLEQSADRSGDSDVQQNSAPSEQTLELVIIDSSVSDYQQMIDDLQAEDERDDSRNLEIVVLDAERDGIAQITSTLLQYEGIDGIHVISHGSDGRVKLGATWLSVDDFQTYQPAISAWQHSLSDQADLMFYGCNLAATEDGRMLMEQIAAACDCDVAGSEDLTGHESLGGDWDLEFQLGEIETSLAVTEATQQSWQHILGSANLTGIWSGSVTGPVSASTTDTVPVTVTATLTAPAGSDLIATTEENLTVNSFFSNAYVEGASSLGLNVRWDTTPEAPGSDATTDDVTTTVTFNFDTAVLNPIIHIDKLGAVGGTTSNSSLWTVTTSGATLTKLAGVGHLEVTSTTFFRTPNVTTNSNTEASADSATGTAAGSIQVNGSFTSLTFEISAVGVEGSGRDAVELAWELAENAAPVITSPGGTLPYNEGTGPFVIGSAATISDSDSTNFDGGQLVLQLTANGLAEDVLDIRHQGTAAGQVGISGTDVTYGGTVVGTYTGPVTGGTALTVTFNSNATLAAVNAVQDNLTYENTSEAPSSITRTIQEYVTDGDGGTSNTVTGFIAPVSINDAPSGTDRAITLAKGTTYVLTVSDFGFSDIDGNSLDRVWITSLPVSGQLLFNGSTFSAGNWVAAADITAGLLTYQPVPGESGAAYATFNFEVQDDGGTANGGVDRDPSANTITFNVSAPNAAPVNSVPAAQATNEDTALVFSSANGNLISISDSESDSVSVTLTVASGSLTLSQTTGLTFVTGADASASMTISGSLVDVNAALDGLQYLPDSQFFGGDSLTVTSRNQSAYNTDLIAFYEFDSASPGDDSSPAGGNDGTLTGPVSAFNGDRNSDVLVFDGDDLVTVLGLMGTPTDVTLAAWVNVDSGAVDGEVISLGDDVAIRIDRSGGGGVSGFFYDGTVWHHTDSSQEINGTGWHHVAYTFDDTNNIQAIYIDGVQIATTAHVASISWTAAGTDTILGKHGFDPAFCFSGLMDDVRVYDRALSAGEITEVMAGFDTDSVSITVNPVNDAPVISTVSNQTIDEDSTTGPLAFTVGDVETAAGLLSVTASSSNTTIIPNGNLTLVDLGSGNWTIQATPAADQNGPATITLTVDDGTTTTQTTFDVTVTPQNDAPTLNLDADNSSLVGGNNFQASFTEGGGPVSIVDSDALLQDIDNTNLSQILVTLTNEQEPGSEESLSADTTGTSLSATWNGLANTLTISGAGTVADYLTVLKTVQYDNSSSNPNTTDRMITFVASDGSANSSTATTTVSISSVNAAPTISSISNQTINEDASTGPLSFTVGDVETPAGLLSVTASSSNTLIIPNGNLTLVDLGSGSWTIQVTPAANQNGGPVTITLTVDDGITTTQTNFDVTVTPQNDAPSGLPVISGTVQEDETLTADTSGISDIDGLGAFSYQWQRDAVDISGATGSTYTTGDADVGRQISVEVRYTDADGTDEGPLTSIQTGPVVNVNDQQTLTTNTGLTVDEGDAGTVITQAMLETTDIDNSPSELIYTLSAVPATGTLRLDGTALINGNTFSQADINAGRLTYDHNDSEIFTDSFSFTVNAGGGTPTSGSFAITANPVNDNDPVITSDGGPAAAAISVAENVTLATIVTAVDADLPAQTLTYSIAGGSDAGRFVIDALSGELSFLTAADFEAPSDANVDNIYEVIVQAADGLGRNSQQTIQVTVTDVDEFGVSAIMDIQATANAVNEDASIGAETGITAFATDSDATDIVTYSLDNDAGGRFAINSGSGKVTVAGVLDRETAATHSIVVRATSTDGSTTTQGFVISLGDVDEFNVSPIVDSNAGANIVSENAAVGTAVGITAYSTDLDATTNAVSYSLDDDAGGRFVINSASGIITTSAALNFESAASHVVVVRATSADLSTVTQSFVINVANVNEAPVATGESFTGGQVVTMSVNAGLLTANDSDPDGDPLTVVLVSNPANGSLILNMDGSFTYQPTGTFSGTDSFTYRVSDGTLSSNVATATLLIQNTLPGPPSTGSTTPEGDSTEDSTPEDVTSEQPADTTPENQTDSSDGADTEGQTSSDADSDSTPEGGPGGSHSNRNNGGGDPLKQEAVAPAATTAPTSVIVSGTQAQSIDIHLDPVPEASDLDNHRHGPSGHDDATEANDAVARNSLFTRIGLNGPAFASVFFRSDTELVTEQQEEREEALMNAEKLVVGTTTVVSTSVSVGYVIWMLRGGSLLTTFLSSLPAWQSFDPLPILESFQDGEDQSSDDESLESLVTTNGESGIDSRQDQRTV